MGEAHPPHSAAVLAVLARLREVFAQLPGITEERDGFGHSSFKVAKKTLATLGEHEGTPSLGIKTDIHTQAALIKRKTFFKTPYVGQHGWTSASGTVKELDWTTIEEVLVDTYKAVAPKKLLKQLETE
jgi:hypothetical protein